MFRYRLARLLVLFFSVDVATHAQNVVTAREFYSRGQQRYSKRDYDGAVADFSRAIELRAGHSNDLQQLRSRSQSAIGRSNSGPIVILDPFIANVYSDRALAHYARGDLEAAAADCESAIAIDPRLAQAYNTRGNIRWTKGDHDGAFTDFERAIAIDPDGESIGLTHGFVSSDVSGQLVSTVFVRAEYIDQEARTRRI